MTATFRMDYHKAIYPRYRKASSTLKSKILDEFCRVCGYNRKYAIRKLSQPPQESRPKGKKRTGRKKTYDRRTLDVVQSVWEAANYPWSARLKEILRLWLPWIQKHYAVSPQMEQKLLAISPSTLDRCLKPKKDKLKRRLYGRTKPGTLLRQHIAVKTGPWDVQGPGFGEMDLVSHSGPSGRGEFLHSLNLTDIFSTWVETRAVRGKGETGVLEALQQIRHDLPFDLLGLDSDNGSEFINYHLVRYCQKEKIQFTRSRPYKKDDNAHIEQKNWTHVRKLMGWDRYDSREALQAINDLYANELRLWMNLFQPSVRRLKTVRVGSRLKRFYDPPRTPLDRLIDSQKGDPQKLARLAAQRKRLDPFELAKTINQKLEGIWQLARHSRLPSKVSAGSSAWTEGLSAIEQQTLKGLSQVFGMRVYVKNSKGELVHVNDD